MDNQYFVNKRSNWRSTTFLSDFTLTKWLAVYIHATSAMLRKAYSWTGTGSFGLFVWVCEPVEEISSCHDQGPSWLGCNKCHTPLTRWSWGHRRVPDYNGLITTKRLNFWQYPSCTVVVNARAVFLTNVDAVTINIKFLYDDAVGREFKILTTFLFLLVSFPVL